MEVSLGGAPGRSRRGIICVQERTRPIRDGLHAVLRGLLTCYFWRLKCEINLTVLIGNFQNDGTDGCLGDLPCFRMSLN